MARLTKRDFDYNLNCRKICCVGADGSCSRPDCTGCVNREMFIKLQQIENLIEDKGAVRAQYEKVRELYNAICKSYPKVTKLSEARKKSIKARFNEGFGIAEFERLFCFAEASDFLKGKNNREWSATFDWMISGNNFVKILDGNYGKPQFKGDHSYNLDTFDALAVNTKK